MKRAIQQIKALVVEDEGATAIEYGLLAALLAGVIITTVTALGTQLSSLFNNLYGQMTW